MCCILECYCKQCKHKDSQNAYKLVTRVNGPGSNSQGHMLSFVGNVKALFKLNVKNESMEKARGGTVEG